MSGCFAKAQLFKWRAIKDALSYEQEGGGKDDISGIIRVADGIYISLCFLLTISILINFRPGYETVREKGKWIFPHALHN